MNNNPVHIVTGATGGIGSAIVDRLIESGVSHIVLACRNQDRAKAMIDRLSPCNVTLTAMQLDLESFDSVINFVMSIRERDMAVDTIFNNAGTMPGTMKLTADGYESATQTNFLSTALLTQMLLPRIINGGAIVFTTSMTRHIAKLRTDWKQHATTHHHRFTTYGRSKLMLTHYALDLARELAPRGIRVNCSDPGIVDSGIITLGNRVIDMLSDKFFRPLISTPAQGAAPALNVAGTQLTGQIFTLNHCTQIPESYLRNPLHSIASEAVNDALAISTSEAMP